eukprot:TRINITY_DN69901_c0_g1_i1.p1 TRINITY_DN69901_c0_g1~~TRINITY_DN69901_c0_g1_i1.p1  ORF type:complete len:299 (-),score=23.49 TRINITY_DN69901_c0_g1_i1:118-1014(-)
MATRNGDDTALQAALQERENMKSAEVFAPGQEPETLGCGDTQIVHNFLTPDEADTAFQTLGPNGTEISYEQWYHMPPLKNKASKKPLLPLTRIKVAQAEPLEDGRKPYYRFPVNDQSRYALDAFTPTIKKIQQKVVAHFKGKYSFNHAVVLLYRNGDDRIGFHQDKPLDLDEESPIVSVSLGANRQYILQDQPFNPTVSQEVTLQHGTLAVLGPKTNAGMYHSVCQLPGLTEARVSITLRSVTTFRDEEGKLSGKGAEYQDLNWPAALKGKHRTDDNLDQPLPEPTCADQQGDAATTA